MNENPNKMISQEKVVIFTELTMDSKELLYGTQYAGFIDFGSLNRKQCLKLLMQDNNLTNTMVPPICKNKY